jgi:hypothetical protein
VYQWKPAGSSDGSEFQADLPCQFQGNVRFKGYPELCYDYPASTTPRSRLLWDLNRMRSAGLGDHRPFTGQLHMQTSGLSGVLLNLLQALLGVSIQNNSSTDTITWAHPGNVPSYRLYPGGPVYNVPTVGSILSQVTLQADPLTNPAGLFYSPSRLSLDDNVTVRGTLITDSGEGDIFITGDDVSVSPAALPALEGTTAPVHLPAMIVCDDLRVFPGAEGSIEGLVAVWDEVEIQQAAQQSINFTLEGRLLGKQFFVRGRDEWDHDYLWWDDAYDDFSEDEDDGGTPYFPVWLQQQRGLAYVPRIRVKPPAGAATYHWSNPANPIYVPHAADPGLRWDVVDWRE